MVFTVKNHSIFFENGRSFYRRLSVRSCSLSAPSSLPLSHTHVTPRGDLITDIVVLDGNILEAVDSSLLTDTKSTLGSAGGNDTRHDCSRSFFLSSFLHRAQKHTPFTPPLGCHHQYCRP